MIMMMAVIHVLFGQQTQQDETSLEADRETDHFPCWPMRVRTQGASEIALSLCNGPQPRALDRSSSGVRRTHVWRHDA